MQARRKKRRIPAGSATRGKRRDNREREGYRFWRVYFFWGFLLLAALGLLWRLIDLNILNRSFLLKQSDARILRVVGIPAYRGMITDRQGSPLAISTPVDSAWVNPQLFDASPMQIKTLAQLLQVTPRFIRESTARHGGRRFVYLKRGNPPALADKIKALDIPGLFFQREYRRYYPEGEVMAHILGITNIDDRGQEGLELAYDKWLQGVPGRREVLKDRLGHIITDVAMLKKPDQGRDLALSVDQRIQYLAYRVLKETVTRYHAQSGSIVVLDTRTNEVLAMVNQPSFNPNFRRKQRDGRYRNRAVTDMFEPGSVIKPFTIALALESGKFTPESQIETSPGWMKVGGYRIKDDLNYGTVTLTQLLQKSSNIAAAKILLQLNPQHYWHLLSELGFGERTASGFPGESAGRLVAHQTWRPSVVATLAYGYGIAVTALQLAHGYAVLADGGVKRPITFLKTNTVPAGERILPENVAKTVVNMLKTVVEKGGTGTRAAVPGYEVAGKTGTAYIAGENGYEKRRYMSSFVGIAPADDPRLVVAVVIRDPQGQHFGGLVAAPAFSQVMGGALRLLDVAPSHR